tara:strand:- start:2836 stop:5178 length:2343 start_codon:yes stop_codon:yes gene_type:complete
MDIEMTVTKRNGEKEIMLFDKIVKRLKNIGNEVNLHVNYTNLAIKVIDQLYDGIKTSHIDELSAQQCASLVTNHPDYSILASRILISNHHKNTIPSFSNVMKQLYDFKDIHGNQHSMISEELYKISKTYEKEIENMIDYDRDYYFNFFGFKTLERAYLMKINKNIIERPQHMWMRVSIGIHGNNLKQVKTTYDNMSNLYFTHATPTLFNAGTPRPQLSSCYLQAMESDSIDGIYNTLKDCANISKWAGGIGLHIHNIRGSGTHIRGTNGTSNGIVPMLRVFNNTARYVDQGGGKRNGSFAIYLEPWHSDIEDFLQMKKNHGDEEKKARDLFYALWIPDLFMKRVKTNGNWTLMCPDECPGLSDVYGDEFEKLYEKYENENRGKNTINARELWFKILDSQIETGTPYMLYKDAANKKSNQKNLGTIKSSNLCTEIIEYSNDKETAVCNLASIGLSKFVKEDKTFDYEHLHEITKIITENLNKVIDINFYPTEKTKVSNMRHRPIGIGVQGLADVFAMMNIPYESDEAREINKLIFETIYHGALEMSYELSITLGYSNNNLPGYYSSFEGSPISQGIFQFDMWGVTPSDRYDWQNLRENIIKYGVRNSLLLAPMPTASTSQILGNNECFEPFTSNIYIRRTLAGEFVIVNKYLMKELLDLNIWNETVKNSIIAHNGSVQQLDISDFIKKKYKTAWEISMKHLIDMSKDRGAFICQSQSLNLWLEEPTYNNLTSMHFYAWESGLKTGLYYLRTRAKAKPQQFTIEPDKKPEVQEDTGCEMCSA